MRLREGSIAGLVASFGIRLFGRTFGGFPEPALERRYRFEQRSRQAWFTIRMIYFGVAGIVGYWLIAFATLDAHAALGIVLDQAWFLPILLMFGWAVGRPGYANAWWADIGLFTAIQAPLYRSVVRVVSTQVTGWPFNTQFCYSLMGAMVFACLTFTAAVQPFAFLTLASIFYLAAVLFAHGYSREVMTFTLQNYVFFALMMCFLNVAIDRKARATFLAQTGLSAEREKSERLLANMLPGPIAERLKSQQVIADQFEDVVVVFVDLVGFTPLSQQLGSVRIVELLNAFFERADHGTDLFELEKVKTIGDAYMAVTNAITRPPRPHKAAVDFAVWLRDEARKVGRDFGTDLRLHVGIASGPAIGGVISSKRLTYDYWGHTVNLAARLQDSVGADGIAVSEPVRRAVGDSYPFHPARSVALKGVGETPVYDVDLPAR